MKKFAALLVFVVCCVLVFVFNPVHSQRENNKFLRTEKPIPNRYIVVLEDWAANGRGESSRADDVARDLSVIYGGKVERTYKFALNGYVAEMTEKEAEALSEDARVKFIEEDGEVYASAVQNGATWGLDRIDQRDLPLSGTYTYNVTGNGVNAYIIDTGIRRTHTNFGGRAFVGFDAIGDGQNTNDCNGHGTHVAGTVGSATYGVAKNVRLYAVRVLNCSGSGSNSGVIAGVDWVTQNHISPAVANMSLGGGVSTALDNAVNNSVASGVTYAVAAGNSNANACNASPARAANAITVGSTTNTDARSSFSNFGTCVDIFAPGSSITSTWSTSDTATNTISGTSMASPHVAGVAALYLETNPGASAATVTSAIKNSATPNTLTGVGTGSPNLFLYSLLTSAPPDPPGSDLIVNGGFESGTSPWVLSGAVRSTGAYPQAGTAYSILGGVNNASHTEYQTITIPTGAARNLRFWLNVTSSETTTTTQFDRLFVEVRSTSGTLLATLATFSNLNKGTAGAYAQQGPYSLASWSGQTVRIQFRGTTDSSLVTSFRVDTVSAQ